MAFESLQALLSSILAALTPRFLGRPSSTSKPRRIHSTAYLDGLRGVAALFVVFAHYEATHFTFLDQGWHEPAKETHASNNYVLQLPIIRTLYTGRFMVTIFFVISGHVLSQEALGLAKRRNYTDLLKSLASSVFRRWLRLMLPALTSSFLFFLVGQFGWLTKIPQGWDAEHTPVLEPLYTAQDLTLSSWVMDALFLINPFRFGDIKFPKFNYPLWTMPVEYTGSMIVFLILIGTSLLRHVLRLVLLASLVGYCLWVGRWTWSLFICGLLIADLFDESSLAPGVIPMVPLTSDVDEEFEQPTWYTTYVEHWVDLLQKYKKRCPKLAFHIVDSLLFLLALYVGSVPPASSDTLALTPGYEWLSPWLPTGWGFDMVFFYPVIGAMLLGFVLAQSRFLQRIFTTRVARYLGDVSLSLYMLHIIVLHTLGNWLIVQCLSIMHPFGGWGFAIGISMALSCCAIVTFWAADVFCGLVDTPSVELTRLVATLAFVQDEPSL